MLLLALILYYASAYNPGIAAPVISSVDSDNISQFFSRNTETPDIYPRKKIEIIWSCIATIIAASWVSVHPDLPFPEDRGSKVKRSFRRVALMMCAILMPEGIICWAMTQWDSVRNMQKEFEDYLNEKQSAETRESGQQEDRIGEVALSDAGPSAAPGDINHPSYPPSASHKTKIDDFKWTRTHGFFLQMDGFVLLEGKEMHILDWKSFMGYYKAGRIDLSDITEACINDHSKADGFVKGIALLQTCWFIIQCIARFADHHLVLTQLELVTAALSVFSLVTYFFWWNKPFNATIPIMITLSNPQKGSSADDSPHQNPGGVGVSNTQTGPSTSDDSSVTSLELIEWSQKMTASSFICTLFGAIHCAGWSSNIPFSSHTTSLLWRISSAIITGSPLVWSFTLATSHNVFKSEPNKWSVVYFILWLLGYCLLLLTIILYITSRIILLILAFVELRDLPPGALATIQWANFIPFIH